MRFLFVLVVVDKRINIFGKYVKFIEIIKLNIKKENYYYYFFNNNILVYIRFIDFINRFIFYILF